jgi:hypothetical protein
MRMKKRFVVALFAAVLFSATVASPRPSSTASLGGKVFKGAVIGYAVKQSAGGLNKFINTITFNHHVSTKLATKVVPILTVGEKAYVGGAQVCGPASRVSKVKAVWQYEDNLLSNRFRIKVLVPSDSLSPLKISRVEKVGISALIDVSLAGGWQYDTQSRSVRAGNVLLAIGVAAAVKNYGDTFNRAINKISFNKGLATKVVPMASFGEKAYIGGGQVSAAASEIKKVAAVWQYEDFFSSGKFRIKILVPTTSSNPLKMKRVDGAGVTAVVDMSLASQRKLWHPNRDRALFKRERTRWRYSDRDDDRAAPRHDEGKHKGWWQGEHKGWSKKGKGGEKIERKFGVDLGVPHKDDKKPSKR